MVKAYKGYSLTLIHDREDEDWFYTLFDYEGEVLTQWGKENNSFFQALVKTLNFIEERDDEIWKIFPLPYGKPPQRFLILTRIPVE